MADNHREAEDEWILRADQLRALVSAVRTDIVDHLAGRGEMSIKELAEAIGKQPSALYHHLEQLLDVGLVVESGARVVNRKKEKLYRTPSRRMRLRKALESGEHADLMGQIVASLSRQADRDFSRGQAIPTARADGEHRNLGFFRLVAKPDAGRLEEINRHLEAIAELMWEENDAEAESMVLTWIMAPGN
ncbi:helix-turn-helix domain-containing protein [Altererythrobacter arenosus]|uniref:Helix-turn-helix domain-containing protein n=1 Tax=Altererythrobacter arenosus TaxID=3032592 RepID=A0ABY8FUT6_9SPHN|nr:helix-turn-helix domain-containing protein [Altererythrobacter sp. CAU 1644]WFL76896.1 helix-turn-helix domain-containing protein [Altererythrobacter sp. CAU 1644]